MRSRPLLAAVLLVSAAACGARSSLREPSGAGATAGSGGTGTTAGPSTAETTSASSVTTGPGGAPSIFCAGLAGVEPLIELPASDMNRAARDPWLELLAQGDVLALSRREPFEGPTLIPSVIDSVRLDPWGSWPPPIHPPASVADSMPDVSFVSATEPKGTFALATVPFPMNAPPGCDLTASFGISPDAPPGPAAMTFHVAGNCDDFPLAVATTDDGSHFVAYDLFLGDKGGLPLRGSAIEVLDGSGNILAQPTFACASTRFVGDVLATATTFLFVQSASDSLDCSVSGTTRRLFLRRFQGATEESFVVADGFDDMVYARILPRKGGSWIFYRESGASAEVQPPGMAVPFGIDSAEGPAFPITHDGSGPMAVAALAGGFVVAYADLIDPSAPSIIVRVYSPTGTLVTQTSFSTSSAWLNGDRLTLIASPDGVSFLVGWTGTTGKPGSGAAMFVKRFDCSIPI